MANPRIVSLRNAFFSGLLLLAPLAVTLLVFSWLIDKVGGIFSPVIRVLVPEELLDYGSWRIALNLAATGIALALVTLLGFVSRLFLGKFILGGAERLVQGIPGINSVYNTVKQIVDTFSSKNRNLFSKVVLVQFPRAGVYSVGFLTNKAAGEPQARTAAEVWSVFVPTTPNPTTGFLILLPKNEIIELDMSVGDAMKLIISGGSVVPPWPPAARPVAVANPDGRSESERGK